jgi:hypothetical protein
MARKKVLPLIENTEGEVVEGESDVPTSVEDAYQRIDQLQFEKRRREEAVARAQLEVVEVQRAIDMLGYWINQQQKRHRERLQRPFAERGDLALLETALSLLRYKARQADFNIPDAEQAFINALSDRLGVMGGNTDERWAESLRLTELHANRSVPLEG